MRRKKNGSHSVPADDAVLNDPRWKALAAGEATPEDIAALREWSERSATAKAAWDSLQPLTAEQVEANTARALIEIQERNERRVQDSGNEILDNKYKLIEKHSELAGEDVWKAENIRSGRPVTVKCLVIAHDETTRPLEHELIGRYQHEIWALERVSHRNIVELLHSGETSQGLPYIVTEHLEGQNLKQFLRETGPLELTQALKIMREIAEAIHAAHAAQLVLRNVAPKNILVRRTDSNAFAVKLTNLFDCIDLRPPAVFDPEHTVINWSLSPYTSPEVVKCSNQSEQADIWSLGILLYEMLTGNAPFYGKVHDLVPQILNISVPPPSRILPGVPAAVDELVLRCTARNPQERYQFMGEVIATLTSIECEISRSSSKSSVVQRSFDYAQGTLPLAPHPYRPTPPPPPGFDPVPESIANASLAVGEPSVLVVPEPPKITKAHHKNGFWSRNGTNIAIVAVFLVIVIVLLIAISAPLQLLTYALAVESIMLLCLTIVTVRRSRNMQSSVSERDGARERLRQLQERVRLLQEKIASLETEETKVLNWLDASDQNNKALKEELKTRLRVERSVYRIFTIGMKATGKSSLTLKWVNPLIDLGTLEGTKVERYERTVSLVRTQTRLVEHAFEVHDCGAEHVVDSLHQLMIEEFHGILMVVDVGGNHVCEIDHDRIRDQLQEFSPQALRYIFSPKLVASCKTVVLFINKSDLLHCGPEEAETQAKALFAPLIQNLEAYADRVNVKVMVGSAKFGHSMHLLLPHFIEQILPVSAYDAQLLERLKGTESRRRVINIEGPSIDADSARASTPLMERPQQDDP